MGHQHSSILERTVPKMGESACSTEYFGLIRNLKGNAGVDLLVQSSNLILTITQLW